MMLKKLMQTQDDGAALVLRLSLGLTRVAAFGVGCTMLVAVLMVHFQNGFFMNWMGAQQGEGFEYHILAIAIAIAVMIKGGGSFSLDGMLAKRSGV
jgi:putative oxidoreductase